MRCLGRYRSLPSGASVGVEGALGRPRGAEHSRARAGKSAVNQGCDRRSCENSIQIEGFRALYNEVLFVDMEPEDGVYEPLLG
jgi:hypothetical protein